MKFRSVKGTRDILPADAPAWQAIERTVRRVMQDFHYREIRTPIFEPTALFSRSIGELTDIVSKEMYTFPDRSGDSLTLRPEGTAAVLRAYVQNNLGEQNPLAKVYYIGPMFRQERPQAGRLRQFHQFGAEALGAPSPALDVEMILLPLEIYKSFRVMECAVKVNSVGCQNCRPRYKELLRAELNKIRERLPSDSQARIDNNPLRVLDSKDEQDHLATANMPLLRDHLCDECRTHATRVGSLLQTLGIRYEEDPRLVRGLDYYTKTAFEITSTALGSQDALAGGGRYDLLVEELGGKPTPGVGFAAGIERLLMVLEKGGATFTDPGPVLYIVALDEPSRTWAFETAASLRSRGVAVEVDYLERSVKAQMRDANRVQAQHVIVVGEAELASGRVRLKNMATGEEIEAPLDQLPLATIREL